MIRGHELNNTVLLLNIVTGRQTVNPRIPQHVFLVLLELVAIVTRLQNLSLVVVSIMDCWVLRGERDARPLIFGSQVTEMRSVSFMSWLCDEGGQGTRGRAAEGESGCG